MPQASLVACSTCAADVSSSAKTCPHCGTPDPAGTAAAARGPKRRDAALTAGWVCVGLYIASAIWLPIVGPVFLAPLPIAAFVLGIVAAARGRVLAGVVLVLVASMSGLGACASGCASIYSDVNSPSYVK